MFLQLTYAKVSEGGVFWCLTNQDIKCIFVKMSIIHLSLVELSDKHYVVFSLYRIQNENQNV